MREFEKSIGFENMGISRDPMQETGRSSLFDGPIEPSTLPMPSGVMEHRGKGSGKDDKEKNSSSGSMGANETIAGLLVGAGLEPKIPKPFPKKSGSKK